MKSRVHPKYKTKYRVSNWTDYDRALVQRGDITLWISEDAIESWKPAPTGRRGAQRKFSDHAIETALILRLVFKLPLRQAEGFLRSVLSLMGADLEAPDHATLSRRNPDLNVDLHRAASRSRRSGGAVGAFRSMHQRPFPTLSSQGPGNSARPLEKKSQLFQILKKYRQTGLIFSTWTDAWFTVDRSGHSCVCNDLLGRR
jgi:hypothetical protein